MKNNLHEYVFCINNTVNTKEMKSHIIEKYNEYISALKNDGNENIISTILFTNTEKIIANRILADKVVLLDDKNFSCRGKYTAFYDTICNNIEKIGVVLNETSEENRPEKVTFILMGKNTEDVSKVFSEQDMLEKIQHQTEKYNWSFETI